MKPLKYIVVYSDGTWAGMFTTPNAAIRVGQKRIKKSERKRLIGVFLISKWMTLEAQKRRSSQDQGKR